MTENEAIHKLEYSKKAYQTLIDEKVDSGKLVGDGVRGERKAETPLNEVYKSMIDALDMAIKALEQQPTRPTARWERLVDDFKKCSKCGRPVKLYRNYKHCPECGARMEEVEE